MTTVRARVQACNDLECHPALPLCSFSPLIDYPFGFASRIEVISMSFLFPAGAVLLVGATAALQLRLA